MDSTFLLYIDPGAGSALLATMLGLIAGATIYLKTKWQSIRYRLKTKK